MADPTRNDHEPFTRTPDPAPQHGEGLASGNEVNANLPHGQAQGGPWGGSAASHPQAQQVQQPGGGGAPTTGATDEDRSTGSNPQG